MQTKNILSSEAPVPVRLYPHAKRVRNLLFLSDIGPREKDSPYIPAVVLDEQGNVIQYDIEKQVHSVFQNVKWILEESGSCLDKVIDVTVFLTNMKDDFKIFNKIWADYFNENLLAAPL